MIRALTLIAFAAAVPSPAGTIAVRCDRGGSLNRTLGRLAKTTTPVTVTVHGTCTELVRIQGFQRLTVKGAAGAALVQPSGGPPLASGVLGLLTVESSRSVTLDGFEIRANIGNPAISVGHGSTDVRLRNLTIEGGAYGIFIWEASQVSLARVAARDPAYATLGVYDRSDVHVEDSLFESSTGEPWHVGVDVGAGHLTVHGTTIRNMQIGINTGSSATIDLVDSDTYSPYGGPAEVSIENPAGTNFHGVLLTGASSMNVFSKLRITGAGQAWGGDTGGILVQDGSTLSAFGNLEITGSQGQGLFVANNSHATLGSRGSIFASRILGSGRNGLVVVNQSTVSVAVDGTPTEITGSSSAPGSAAKDLFCDSTSLVTGGANLSHDPSKAQCDRLLPGASETIPY
jgi:hypothetical protein